MRHETMKRAGAVFAAALLALAGCAGEDGVPGAAGAPGEDGTSCSVRDNLDGTLTVTCTDGTSATVANGTNGTNGTNGQSCSLTTGADGSRTVTCPDGSAVVLPAVALSGHALVSDQAVAVDGADVVVTFKVALNGVPSGAFTNKAGAYRSAGATSAETIRTSIATTAFTVTADSSGAYTARFPGLATTVGSTPTTYLITLNAGAAEPAATVVAHSAAGKPKATVGDQACMNCHGVAVFREGHHENNPQGASACVVCHVRADRSETRLGTASTITNGAITAVGTAPGTRLMGYVHGIHNSHNMADRVYSRNGSATSTFSVGFPSYMNNCSTCHDTAESLALVMAKPISYATCISCHDGWDGFGVANTGTPEAPVYLLGGGTINHAGFDAATTCSSCHGTGFAAAATVGDVHGKRQMYTERNGLLYDGKDQSIEQGKRVVMTIGSITPDNTDPLNKKLVVTWSATLDGNPVDPCNTTVSPTAPVFIGATANATTGQSASNMSLLQAYAQGNDWVSAGVGTSPGQPISENLTATNTTCASNVATSTIAASMTTTATKGVLGLQGKPQLTFASTTRTGAAYTRVIQLRSKSPTREFVVATGAEPAAADARRPVVNTEKCLSCHQGSLYQHGGNRVDNVALCVMCHNPASNEKNNRVNMAVPVGASYDGKPGQTYDLRYMLHAVHSAGATNAPLVYYRTNGIYAFGSEAAINGLPNWPGAGCFPVYGSTQSQSASGATSTGAQCDSSATGAGVPTKKNHNEIVVHYPRALNDCAACHVSDSGSVTLPSTTWAVAVTTNDAGASPWSVQTDDVLMSPATASCMSCHQSGDAAMQSALRAHAFQNSWTPAVFTNGRADVLGGGASESCVLCHGPGRDADFNAKHGN